jgi:hypothetical protein
MIHHRLSAYHSGREQSACFSNSSPMTQYRYRPLQSSEMRIVRFRPSTSANPDRIEAKLFHVPFDSVLDCFALSYVWHQHYSRGKSDHQRNISLYGASFPVTGNSDQQRNISLDGTDFPVTENLYRAISDLRNRYDPGRKPIIDNDLPELNGKGDHGWADNALSWWIDAICINQADINERSRQVPRMRAIYNNAAQVVIYLTAVDHGTTASKAVGHMVEVADFLSLWTPAVNCTYNEMISAIIDTSPILVPTLGWVLDRLPWAKRIWVIQEAVLAQPEPVVLLGQHVTSLTKLVLLQKTLQKHLPTASEHNRGGIDAKDDFVLSSSDFSDILEVRKDYKTLRWKSMQFQAESGDFGIVKSNVGQFVEAAEKMRADSRAGYDYESHGAQGTTASTKPTVPLNTANGRYNDTRPVFYRTSSQGLETEHEYSTTEFGMELRDALCRISGKKTTLPHDRIYGLLGMTSSAPLPVPLRPDYSQPFAQVFQNYARFLVESTSYLDILELGVNRLPKDQCPSWVPDFSQKMVRQTRPPTTSLGAISNDGKCLSVTGVILGKVEAVYEYKNTEGNLKDASPSEISNDHVWSTFSNLAGSILQPAAKLGRSEFRAVLKEWAKLALSLSIKGGDVEGFVIALDNLLQSRSISGTETLNDTWNLSLQPFIPQIWHFVKDIEYLLLHDGTICICPGWQEPSLVGDLVCIFRGNTGETVIRPISTEGFKVLNICTPIHGLDTLYTEEFFERREERQFKLY